MSTPPQGSYLALVISCSVPCRVPHAVLVSPTGAVACHVNMQCLFAVMTSCKCYLDGAIEASSPCSMVLSLAATSVLTMLERHEAVVTDPVK
jgi:hypothetical protein